MRRSTFLAVSVLAFLTVAHAQAQRLVGFADMHAHPMSHLGFGGFVVYGAPDEGSLMLAGQKYRGWHAGAKNCNESNEPAGSIGHALGFDNQVHGGPGIGTTSFGDANNCGDVIRTAIIDKIEEKYIHEYPNPGLFNEAMDHPHGGYPSFTYWPHWSSVTHQQMWWEWIKRSVDGGQRVMVALAVNNSLLAKAVNASQYVDDKSSVEIQIQEIKRFVARHRDFMEVALTPAHLRRIVLSNRMAVVLGVETDDFGNLTRRAAYGGERITQSMVDAELMLLHNLGVRYILPLHFSNTVLGGYAINRSLFALSSKEYTNSFPAPVETCDEGIQFALQREGFDEGEAILLRSRDLGRIIDTQPVYPVPRPGCGHKNSLSLTPLGEGALRTMMNLGMMIDIDHMSRLAADRALQLARLRDYPLNSGHNGPLSEDCLAGRSADPKHCTENLRTREQYEKIRALGGMVGLGHGGKATNFVRIYRNVLDIMGNRPVAIGTDANGLETLPAPDPMAPVSYGPSFPIYRFAERTWNINSRINAAGQEIGDGFAHYGLFPDYIKSWRSSADPASRMTERSMDAFMSSAEGFARMWEKSFLRAWGAPRTANLSTATTWCPHTLHVGDFNGDGADDLLCKSADRMSIDYADVRGVLTGTEDWSLATKWCTHTGAELRLADFDGDRRTDLLCRDTNRLGIDYADALGRFAGQEDWGRGTSQCTRRGDAQLSLADFDGDGRADLLCREPNAWSIDYADASGRFMGWNWGRITNWCTHNDATLRVADFNGDGRADLLCRDPGRLWIDYADPQYPFAGEDWVQDTDWCGQRTAVGSVDLDGDGRSETLYLSATLSLADFNGDGRTDLLCRDPNRVSIDYADAEGRFAGQDWTRATRWCTQSGARLELADPNGDSRKDLLCRDRQSLQIDYADASGRFES